MAQVLGNLAAQRSAATLFSKVLSLRVSELLIWLFLFSCDDAGKSVELTHEGVL
jgi:hypothetical protein